MDLRKVKKLIELVEESAIEELEVANGEESVRIVMRRGAPAPQLPAQAVAAAAPAPGRGNTGRAISAPMAGTFYRAPHPGADPFTDIGRQVAADQIVCIIESMKMMHEIRAGQDGTVTDVCVDDGAPIATGDVLFKLS